MSNLSTVSSYVAGWRERFAFDRWDSHLSDELLSLSE